MSWWSSSAASAGGCGASSASQRCKSESDFREKRQRSSAWAKRRSMSPQVVGRSVKTAAGGSTLARRTLQCRLVAIGLPATRRAGLAAVSGVSGAAGAGAEDRPGGPPTRAAPTVSAARRGWPASRVAAKVPSQVAPPGVSGRWSAGALSSTRRWMPRVAAWRDNRTRMKWIAGASPCSR